MGGYSKNAMYPTGEGVPYTCVDGKKAVGGED